MVGLDSGEGRDAGDDNILVILSGESLLVLLFGDGFVAIQFFGYQSLVKENLAFFCRIRRNRVETLDHFASQFLVLIDDDRINDSGTINELHEW